MSAHLPDAAKAMFDGPQYVSLATINPDGQPQVSVVWVARDGDDLLISTAEGRQKHRNVVADPRATVLAVAADNPFAYVEVRGTVSLTHDGARELIDTLAAKYMGADRYTMDDGTDNVRVTLRITPDKVVAQL